MVKTYYKGPSGKTIDKSPGEIKDYPFDWTDYLADPADTISGTPTVTISPSGGLEVDSSPTVGNITTAWLSGGVDGVTYAVTCEIETSQGRTERDTIYVKVKIGS